MHTSVLKISAKKPQMSRIQKAARLIKQGGIVAFPTETVYGLGANALDAKAVRKIFVAKGRPSDNPLIVHIYDMSDLYILADKVTDTVRSVVDRFWPGPLTIVLKKSKIVPNAVTGGLDTVAVRMPSSKIAQMLIRESKTPIAAPSANYFGRPSPTTASHVLQDMKGRIGLIIDGGSTKIGIESTVVDLTSRIPVLLRPGGVGVEQLQKEVGEIRMHPMLKGRKSSSVFRSPGMKYKHYSPDAQIILVQGPASKVRQRMIRLVKQLREQNERVGVICTKDARYGAHAKKITGSDYDRLAAVLFKTFRDFDSRKIDVILVQAVPKRGIGLGIMNRLEKAAYRKIRAR